MKQWYALYVFLYSFVWVFGGFGRNFAHAAFGIPDLLRPAVYDLGLYHFMWQILIFTALQCFVNVLVSR